MTFPGGEDRWKAEQDLDLNAGWLDQRARNKTVNLDPTGSRVQGPSLVDFLMYFFTYQQVDKAFTIPQGLESHCPGGRALVDEYGKYDSLDPVTGILTLGGLAVAIYLRKPGSRVSHHYQEVHLLRMAPPPEEITKIYHGRVGSGQ